MEEERPRIVIVGAGHAGGRAAEALRAAGFAGAVTLIGDETHPPYERPPLSKDLLAGKIEPEQTYLLPRAWYDENGVELRLGARVEAIDREAGRVVLADGAAVPYDRLLLTTGARARRLPIEGTHLPGVHYVRDIADSLTLRQRLRPGARLLVVGAGFIGLEVAAVARTAECGVTVVELAAHPLGRVAPHEIGDFFAALHRGHGVDLRLGAGLTAIEAGGGRLVAFTGDGDRLEADAVLIGIGAVPNSGLAEAASLEVDDGILVDEFGRTTRDAAIYAAGDVTRHFNPVLGRHVRLEAWQNAQNQAIAVAKAMAAASAPYAEVPWFWTDQYDVNFQSAGAPLAWERLVWRGRPEEGRCTVFYLQDGRVVGGATINNGRDMRFLRQLIARGAPVDADALGDPAVKLAELCCGA